MMLNSNAKNASHSYIVLYIYEMLTHLARSIFVHAYYAFTQLNSTQKLNTQLNTQLSLYL